MNIYEFQAKSIFSSFNIPVLSGEVAGNTEQALKIAERLGYPVVVKAQVHAGGRGKAGGVKLARGSDELERYAEDILKLKIKGLSVNYLLIEQAAEIDREFYLGIVLDRNSRKAVIIASREGGVEIEEVAKNIPHLIYKQYIDMEYGLLDFQAQLIGFEFFAEKEKALLVARILKSMYSIFVKKDATLLEINPLVITRDGRIMALDGKINFDDNSIYRNPDIEEFSLIDKKEDVERSAKEHGLSFIPLEGNIGCMVNGAGLAMATMDIIKKYGGEPANFLDIGGSSNPQKVIKAFEIILSDSNVKAIFINIFGGITRCDDVANGIISAYNQMSIKVPIVVRLTGTNAELAKKILSDSPLISASCMSEGARKAVELSRKGVSL